MTATAQRIGSLFSGYGGLDLAVEAVLGAHTDTELAWVSDVCKVSKDGTAGHYEPHRGACAVLAHRFPGVPNLGDITRIDWSIVAEHAPVDIITGGSPCQDLSHAGKRAGMTEGTRSNLWVQMREAIAVLRPSLVIWENVRGAYSAAADSSLVDDGRLLGPPTKKGRQQPGLRALGRVLGDLADLGFDAEWIGLRAADVGAPHGRFRVFVVAYPQGAAGRLGYGDGAAAAVAADLGHERAGRARERRPGPADGALLPTPRATDGTKGGPGQHGSSGDLMLPSAVALLPTPTSQAAKHTSDDRGPGTLDDCNLWSVATRLLQTPSVADALGGHETLGGARSEEPLLNGQAKAMRGGQWGDYAEAITRWEHVLGRPAPAPTMTSTKGNPQLAPVFVEWLMGLPAGWVTDVPGITRNEALKALGNGVVPQQAAAASTFLLNALERAA